MEISRRENYVLESVDNNVGIYRAAGLLVDYCGIQSKPSKPYQRSIMFRNDAILKLEKILKRPDAQIFLARELEKTFLGQEQLRRAIGLAICYGLPKGTNIAAELANKAREIKEIRKLLGDVRSEEVLIFNPIFVRPEFRRKGIGKDLFELRVNYVDEQGKVAVMLAPFFSPVIPMAENFEFQRLSSGSEQRLTGVLLFRPKASKGSVVLP